MNLSLLEAFRVIMQTGTVSAAADTMGRSQPAVSRMLDKLEQEMGLTLFDRRKGRITPTHEAHLLLDEIERTFASLSSLNDLAARIREGREGGVSMAVLPALGLEFMPEVIAQFNRLRPQARVVMSVRMSASVEHWVATQQVDFGLAETPFKRTGLNTRLFADTSYVAAIPADHRLAGREVIGPGDLKDEPMISWTAFVTARRIFDDIMQGAGIAPRSIYESTMSAPMCAMVRRGLGIAIVDPFTAAAQRNPAVVFRPFRPAIPCRIAMLIPQVRQPNALARDFIDCAEAERDRVLSGLFD